MASKPLPAVALLASLLVTVASAWAASARVAVVTDAPDDPLIHFLFAELKVSGFAAVFVSPRELENSTESKGGTFEARMVPSAEGVEVWLTDGSKSTLLEVVPVRGLSSERTAAVRSVEVLRATLNAPRPELDGAPEPRPIEQRPQSREESVHVTNPESRSIALFVGPAAMLSNHAPSAWGVALEGRWQPAEHWAFGLSGVIPVSKATLSGGEGTAMISWSLAGMTVGWLPQPRARRLQPYVGAGLGVGLVDIQGSAQPPRLDRDDRFVVLLPSIRSGITVDVSKSLALRFDGLLGTTVPDVTIRFAGREVTSWGRAVGTLSAGVQASFP